jgi:hypothetical protein
VEISCCSGCCVQGVGRRRSKSRGNGKSRTQLLYSLLRPPQHPGPGTRPFLALHTQSLQTDYCTVLVERRVYPLLNIGTRISKALFAVHQGLIVSVRTTLSSLAPTQVHSFHTENFGDIYPTHTRLSRRIREIHCVAYVRM